jgi:hypothetical protein
MILCPAIAVSVLLGAPSPPSVSPADRPEELVKLLGDKSYRVREVAARELIRRGSASVAALNAALKDTDPEVSERARQLLPQAATAERNEKLAQLVKNSSAPPPNGLAGLQRFLKATGDNKEGRELYAEMMATHYRTIEAADTDPKDAAEQFLMFGNDAYQKWQAGARVGRYSYDNMFSSRADITFFLFVSGDERVRQHENGPNYSSILFNGTQIPRAISDKDGSAAMRKLFLDWLEHEPQPHMQQRGFQLASQAGLKEALPIALRLLEKKDQQPYAKAQVVLALAKLGTKEHIPLLDKYLDDKTNLGSINFGNGPQLTVQLRDVAMAVQIELAGQKLGDYGYDTRYTGAGFTSYHYYGFPEESEGKSKARDEAHARWKEWALKNLGKAATEKAPVKTEPKPEKK